MSESKLKINEPQLQLSFSPSQQNWVFGKSKKHTYEKLFLTLRLKVFPLSQSIPPYMDPYHRVVNLRVRKTICIIIHPYSHPKGKSCHQHWSVTSLFGHIRTGSTGPHEAAPLILQCIYSLEKPSMNPAEMHPHICFIYWSQILLSFISVAFKLPFLLNLKSLGQQFACTLVLIYSLKMTALMMKVHGYTWCLLLLLLNRTVTVIY